jgi:single-stranded-DNA-specific exonuclease
MSSNPPKLWVIKSEIKPITPEADRALRQFSPIMRQLLYNRGYETAETAKQYMDAQLPAGSDPMNMLGVPAAVERIWQAIQKEEHIAVYGDYDADGVTATALLTDLLKRLGAQVQGYIPNRFDEGYGLNTEALDTLQAGGISLVVTVDCGIRSMDEAEHARRNGLDLIITDHHHPLDELPRALALVNPKQPGESYPDQNLAGVGLAYKLGCALLEKTRSAGYAPAEQIEAEEYLDLVALGTVSDQAPLIAENRALVRAGLEYIRRPRRQGVLSLIGAAQLNALQITADSIGFGLGPRLNAAGRLDSALAALNLLLTQDLAEAAYLAQQLDNQNRERQQITREIQAHAEEQALAEEPDALLLFSVDENYNPGVIGLAASRLMEQYYRPSIVAFHGPDFTRGSCRSIPEFHITKALDECADLLVRHGGHSAAAGFTVRNEHLSELVQRLRLIAQRQLGSLDLRPTLYADTQVNLSDLTPDLLNDLGHLQPTGQNNPAARFVSRNVRVLRSRTVGKDSSHLKLTVSDGTITYDAIAFRQGHLYSSLTQYLDLIYNFERNEYNGFASLQLNVQDIHLRL